MPGTESQPSSLAINSCIIHFNNPDFKLLLQALLILPSFEFYLNYIVIAWRLHRDCETILQQTIFGSLTVAEVILLFTEIGKRLLCQTCYCLQFGFSQRMSLCTKCL